MATKIPPHNLRELISSLVALLDNNDITIDELIENHIQGPDFPTGGYIMGIDGVHSAFKTGRGRVIMRGRAEIEELPNGKEIIIITEIPYQVNKANLVEKIADLVRDNRLEGISVIIIISLPFGSSSISALPLIITRPRPVLNAL
jgi:DNA gyrase subunit A